jgi:hypothetical protein
MLTDTNTDAMVRMVSGKILGNIVVLSDFNDTI